MESAQSEDWIPHSYHFGIGPKNTDRGKFINIDVENRKALQFVEAFRQKHGKGPDLYIVPGHTPDQGKAIPLHGVARLRLNAAAKKIGKNKTSFVLVSGGNANPKHTPYNEAMEMKRYLMEVHSIPEFLIAIDPNAQNTVTNLRNAGRFMKSIGLKQAMIVTTLVQNLYISLGVFSGFRRRSQKMLGFFVGNTSFPRLQGCFFWPSDQVVQKSHSQDDP